MWEKVQSRKHTIGRVYAFGADGEDKEEIMLWGVVDYVLKSGEQSRIPWAARATFEKEEAVTKMETYQVYMASTPPSIITCGKIEDGFKRLEADVFGGCRTQRLGRCSRFPKNDAR